MAVAPCLCGLGCSVDLPLLGPDRQDQATETGSPRVRGAAAGSVPKTLPLEKFPSFLVDRCRP